tara:strand:+ start:699 stop:1058 length:360 start_codon:yes stop_codon:yes gene_type:complete
MSETIISTRCVECGSDTMKDGYVNRCSYGGDGIDAYNCGQCQTAIEYYIFGDSAYEDTESYEEVEAIDQARENDPDWAEKHCDEEAYDKYLEERIEEIDKQDPGAKPFRELVQSIWAGA